MPPSASPTSKTRHTAGWVICRASRTSLRMRSRPSGPVDVDHLQRDRGLEDEVVGAPDVAHPAPADPRDHPIAAGEHLARREHVVAGLRTGFHLVVVVVVVECQQRLDFLPQGGIVAAGSGQKGAALGRRPGERLEKHVLRALV